MNVSDVPRSIFSIGLSSRPAAAGATSVVSGSWSAFGAVWGSTVGLFAGRSDISCLLFRCLESELYALVVALSIIFASGIHLTGKVVAVTGASSGIGESTALACAQAGAAVALAARRGERIERLAAQIAGDGGRALAVEADVGDEQQAS